MRWSGFRLGARRGIESLPSVVFSVMFVVDVPAADMASDDESFSSSDEKFDPPSDPVFCSISDCADPEDRPRAEERLSSERSIRGFCGLNERLFGCCLGVRMGSAVDF